MRRTLSYPHVVSTVAMFVALGGTSYAVVKLPSGSVGSREVRNGSLQDVDLANSAKVAGPRGPRGAAGPPGTAGAAGTQGPRGPSSVITASRLNIPMAATGPARAVDVVTLNVPAGAWWVLGSVSGVVEGSTASVTFRCSLVYGSVEVQGADAVLGIGGGAARAAGLTLNQGRTLDVPTAIRLRCGPESDIPGGIPRADFAQLTAVRTDDLQIQTG